MLRAAGAEAQHRDSTCVFCSPWFSTFVERGTEPTKKLIALKLELMGAPGFFWCDEDFASSLPEQALQGIDQVPAFIVQMPMSASAVNGDGM